MRQEDIVYERSNTWISPDSGTTSGSRQTLVTGEACRRACEKLMEDRRAGKELKDMKGIVYYGEYLAKTDPLGANVPNPVSHVAYGYATQMCVVDPKTGKLDQIVAAHDVGKGGQSTVLRRSDRGRCGHVHGLRPAGNSIRSMRTVNQYRNMVLSDYSVPMKFQRSKQSL